MAGFLEGLVSGSSEVIRRIALCRDARLCVRCVKGYSVEVLTGTDAQIVRPYNRYSSHRVTRFAIKFAFGKATLRVKVAFRKVVFGGKFAFGKVVSLGAGARAGR